MKLLTFLLLNIFCFSVVSLCGQENNSNTTIEFIVFDSISNKTLSEVEVQIYGSNGVDVYKTTNNEGKVVFSNQEHKELFEEGVTYMLTFFKENYFKKNYNVLDFKSGIETKKILLNEFIIICETPFIILFEKNVHQLNLNNKDFENDFIMSVVIDFLKNDNEKHLNIYGNYDCNESRKLANKRAKSCFEYFVKSGIDKKRLHIVPFDKNEIKFDRKTCDSYEIDESINQGMMRVDFEIVYENQKDSVIDETKNTPSNLESVQLEKPIQIELHVFDKETKNPIPNAKVTFTKSDKSEIISNTDNSGKVIFENVISNDTSLSHRKFSYAVSKNGFIVVQDDKILSKGKNKISDTIYMLNVVDKVLDLPQIWFAYDKKDLLVQEGMVNSYDSLDYLYQILIDNPSFVVEIQVHSDCRGSNKYSIRLSPARAQSCLEYLVSKGIPKERLIASGYGSTVPRKPGLDCESINKMTTKEEQEKAHQQNRRVQYKVLSFEYKPKVDFDINDVPKVEYEFD